MQLKAIVVIALLAATALQASGSAIDAGRYVAQRADVTVEGRTCEIAAPLVPAFALVAGASGLDLPQGSIAVLRDDAGNVFALVPPPGGRGGDLQMRDLARAHDGKASGTATISESGSRTIVELSYRRALPDCRVRGRVELQRVPGTDEVDHVSRLAAAYALVAQRKALAAAGALREARDVGVLAHGAFTATLGADHPVTLVTRTSLAELYWRLDELPLARRTNDEAIAALTRVIGAGAFSTLHARQNQALVRWYQGDVDEAERELREVIQHYGVLLDPDDLEIVSTLGNLGALLLQRGRLVEAERIMFDVLARFERAVGPDDARTLIVLNNLAVMLDNGGRLDESLSLYATLVQRYERVGGRAHPNALNGLMNQADTLGRLGRFEEAIALSREAWQGLREALGSTHTDTLIAQHNLAWLLLESGQLDEAWILQRALVTLRDRVDGADSREALKARNVLGGLEVRRGDVDAGLSRMTSALAAARRTLGAQDPATLEIAARVAASQREAGRPHEARRTLRELVARIEDWRDSGAMTAETRRAFLAPWVTSYKSLAALDLAAGDVRAAFDQAERSKARVLVELLSRRRGESEAVLPPDALQALANLDRKLVDAETRVAQAGPDPSARAPLEVVRVAIADEGRRLRSALRERHPKYASLSEARIVDVEEGARALPQDTLFVSYLRDGERVLAFTLDRRAQLAGHDLGAIPGLDDAILAYRTLLADANTGSPTPVWRLPDGRYRVVLAPSAGARRVTRAAQIGRMLFERLVAPLPGVRHAKRLIVSPDGALAIVPFEALPYGGRPLVASHEVTYAPSLTVHALTASRAAAYDRLTDRLPLYAMGGAHYAERSATATRPAVQLASLSEALKEDPAGVRRAYDFVNARWSPLPSSLTEVREVAALFQSEGATTLRTSADATERRLLDDDRNGTLSRHRYVLLSAHGLLSTEAPNLSAVVLGQDDVTPEADGYVTAAEWTSYTLQSDLIVISACQTGAGRIIAGEGVAGLPYALFVAGNRNAMLTLWPVADESAARFVARFFAHLRAGSTQSDALARTKREFATKGPYTAPFHWAAFTLWGS